jgi:probable phosphoglycerate mutase
VSTTIYLVRHATHALVDRALVARTPHIGLSPLGRQEAHALAQHFAHEPIASVQSSPQQRAIETAEFIADAVGLPIEIAPQMDEFDAGAWTGLTFSELEGDSLWCDWNCRRGSTHAPGGESMRDVQDRVVDYLTMLHRSDPDSKIVIVSHAEPIRAAVLHYRRLPLDDFARVRIAPGSITTLRLNRDGGEIVDLHGHLHELVSP